MRLGHLFRAFLFLGILAAGAAALELSARHLFGPDEARTDILRKLVPLKPQDMADIEALFLGNSHAQAGLRPKLYSVPSRNLAHGSQDLYYDLEIYRRYGAPAPRLKTLVVTLDPYLFGFRTEMIDRVRTGAYAAAGIPPGSSRGGLRDVFEHHSFFLRYRTILIKKVLSELRGAAGSLGPEGLEEAVESMSDEARRRNAVSRAHFHRSSCMDVSSEPQNEAHLIDLIGEAQKRGVRVVLVTLPYSSEYRAAVDPYLWERFDASLKRVMEKSGGDRRYVSFLEDPDFVSEDYYDSDHLNEKGARKLALKIQPLLEGQPRV